MTDSFARAQSSAPPPTPPVPPPPNPTGPPGTYRYRAKNAKRGLWQPIEALPPWRTSIVALVLVLAVMGDLALRVPVASLAASACVGALVALLALTGRLRGPLGRTIGGLLVASAIVLAIRDSTWVITMVSVSIMAVATLATAGGLAIGPGRPWLRAAGRLGRGIRDVLPWLASGSRRARLPGGARQAALVRSAAIGLVVAVVVGGLLASGDAAFGWLVSLFDLVSWFGHGFVVALLVLPVAAMALTAVRSDGDDAIGPSAPSPGKGRLEARTAVWALAAVLGAWVTMQVALVAGGASRVLADQGLTAAEYARRGFFQLVAVAAISLVIVNLAYHFGQRNGGPDRAQRIPVVIVGVALVVLIAVTFSRLGYYVGSFGLTMLRLSVATFLAWLAVMAAMLVARSLGAGPNRTWLPTAAVLSAATFALLFGAANPERWVATVNLERAATAEEVDLEYLSGLSSDAKSMVEDYPWARLGGRPAVVTAWLCETESAGGYGPLGWNRSRAYRPGDDIACGAG